MRIAQFWFVYRRNLTWKSEIRCLVFGLLPSSAVTLSDHPPMDINTKSSGKCFSSILKKKIGTGNVFPPFWTIFLAQQCSFAATIVHGQTNPFCLSVSQFKFQKISHKNLCKYVPLLKACTCDIYEKCIFD